jgi:hypothetical protein
VTLLLHLCEWLAGTAIGTGIRESDNLFSVIETIHVLGITITAGTITIVDMRILGFVFTRYAVADVMRPLVTITWLGFLVMLTTGVLLFWSEADKLYFNTTFRLKLSLLLLAGLNQWMFQRTYAGRLANWNESFIPPARARFAAWLSLGMWAWIIVLGRAIAYM